ncbi:hypothetical protein K7432_012635 [Basidiobolus ranarum]|uniref:Uncharacterized protein n=1 Tax=Basidiobolus ranarum TaxID=34480 RepID=A0ABR2WKG3_9FUNG
MNDYNEDNSSFDCAIHGSLQGPTTKWHVVNILATDFGFSSYLVDSKDDTRDNIITTTIEHYDTNELELLCYTKAVRMIPEM